MKAKRHCISPFFFVLLVVLLTLPAPLLAQQNADEAPVLRVVTKALPPFVFIENGQFSENGLENGQFSGFSIELWDAIAQEMGVDYEFFEVETVSEQLEALQDGRADVAIAGITITEEREELIDFSFSYFDSGLQIMVRQEVTSPITNILQTILSTEMLQFLLVFLGMTLLIAHALWLVERRSNRRFPQGYIKGVSQALWWSTITAIGYDDRPPNTAFGRILAIIWMFTAIFVIANLTATLSANATVRELRSNIRGIADLQNQRVVTVAGTTSARYLQSNGFGFSTVPEIETAYALLLDGDADAVVYDAPVLRYFIRTAENSEIGLAGSVFAIERYGIAVPQDSPNRETINRALLKVQEGLTYQQIYDRWFSVSGS